MLIISATSQLKCEAKKVADVSIYGYQIKIFQEVFDTNGDGLPDKLTTTVIIVKGKTRHKVQYSTNFKVQSNGSSDSYNELCHHLLLGDYSTSQLKFEPERFVFELEESQKKGYSIEKFTENYFTHNVLSYVVSYKNSKATLITNNSQSILVLI